MSNYWESGNGEIWQETGTFGEFFLRKLKECCSVTGDGGIVFIDCDVTDMFSPPEEFSDISRVVMGFLHPVSS